MQPVFYPLSLDYYLCQPQTSRAALNQGAGAWVFMEECVRARGGVLVVLSILWLQSD